MSSHNPFERAKSLDYGLFDIEKNMSGLPEGFKKKVESLLRADADDEHDHMGQVTERKRHYAQILRIRNGITRYISKKRKSSNRTNLT